MIPHQTLLQHQLGYVYTSNMKRTSHKTWQTSLLFLELLQIKNLTRKSWGTWHITSPHLKKWGETSLVSPTKLRPCCKPTFLPMVTIVVLHHKYVKLFKPFTPHVIERSARKGFNQSIRRTKEQKRRLQCLAWTMPNSVMPSGPMKSAKLLRRKSARIWQC